MNPLLWVLAGLLLYAAIAKWAQTRGLLPNSIKVQGPLTTIHTKRGKAFLNWLAQWDRFWRAWTNVGLGVALVIMVGVFFILVQRAVSIVQNPPPPTAVNNPQNVLVIPGVNEFLPLSVAPEIVFGLLVGLVVHEGGHGLLCRVGDIEIESMGLVTLAILPIGAFVEPDEESQARAERGDRARMFAAGVTNNFVITILAFALLLGPVAGSIVVAQGAAVGAVFPNSAAADAGISQGDRITAVGGTEVGDADALDAYLANSTEQQLQVTVDGDETVTVDRSLLVTAMAVDSPFAERTEGGQAVDESGISVNETVVAVNGTQVTTEPGLREAVANQSVVMLETADGDTATGPIGVLATATTEDSVTTGTQVKSGMEQVHPLRDAGFPTDEQFVLVSIGETRTLTPQDVTDALADREGGEEVRIVAYVDGERQAENVTLTEDWRQGQSGGYLGIAPSGGGAYSGVSVNSFGVRPYPADAFLSLLSGVPGGSLLQQTLFILILPFASALGLGFGFNFPGFVASNRAFYEVTGPLEPFGGLVFLLANILFWTGWVNLNLAFFNCIPAFPLDGGRILRTVTEAVVSRLPVGDKQVATRTVTTSVGLAMLVCLIVMLFGPQLLGG
jgi:membrane-associated protease RseP (regulator of RpoE activity)